MKTSTPCSMFPHPPSRSPCTKHLLLYGPSINIQLLIIACLLQSSLPFDLDCYHNVGIDKFGVGNWKVIAEYLGTGKSTRQVEEHYWEGYMGTHGYCLPALTRTGPLLVPSAQESGTAGTSAGAGSVGRPGRPSAGGVGRGKRRDSLVIAAVQEPEEGPDGPPEGLVGVTAEGVYERGELVQRDAPVTALALSSLSSGSSAAATAATAQFADCDNAGQEMATGRHASDSRSGTAAASAPSTVDVSAESKGGDVLVEAKGMRDRLGALPGSDLPGFMPLRGDFDIE